MSNVEHAAKSLLTEAMSSVKGQITIVNGDDRHVVYIHDMIVQRDGRVDIDWSTPSEDVDKEWLFGEIHKAITLMIAEQNKPSKWEKLKSGFSDFFSNWI